MTTMICKICGEKINDNSKFCPNCGAETSIFYNETSEKAIEVPKKRNGRKVFIGLAVFLFVIVLCGVVIAALLPKIQMAVMGESTYYIYQESKNVSSLLTSETISDLRHPEAYSAKSVAKANFSGDEYVSEILNSMQATATVNYDKASATVNSDLSLEDDGNNIFTLNGDYIDSKFIIGSDLMRSQLAFDNPLLKVLKSDDSASNNALKSDDYGNYEDEALIINYLSEVDTEELLKVSRKILKENVDSKATSSKQNINGKNANMITFTFSGSDLDGLSAAFIDELMNNDKLAPVAEKICKAYYRYYFGYDQYDASVTALESFKNDFQENSPISQFINQVTFSYACDSRGNILYRGFIVDYGDYQTEGKIYTTFDGKDVASLNAEIKPDSDFDKGISISFSKTVSGGSTNVDLKYSDMDNTEFSINISNMRSEKCSGVPVLLGTCKMNLFSEGDEMFDVTANATNLVDKYDISVQGSIYGEASFEGTVSTSLSTEPNVTNTVAPENYDTDIPDYITELFNDIGSTVVNYVDNKYAEEYYYY